MKVWVPPAGIFVCALALMGGDKRGERLIYAAENSRVDILDVGRGHKLLRRVEIPDSGRYLAMAVSPRIGKLYVSSRDNGEVICVELATGSVLWRRRFGRSADSMTLTPDGKRLYVSFRDEAGWRVLDPAGGAEMSRIEPGDQSIGREGSHCIWMNPEGTRAYMSAPGRPYVYVADTGTNQVIGKIGPFSTSVGPFIVTNDEKQVFANIWGMIAFEVAEIGHDPWGGRMLHRVETLPPGKRLAEIPAASGPESTVGCQGIALRPDQEEVWLSDSIYGYVYAFDVTSMPPRRVASVPLYKDPKEQPHPSWLSFGIDGRYLYTDAGAVIDVRARKVSARIASGEKLVEVDFEGSVPVKAGP